MKTNNNLIGLYFSISKSIIKLFILYISFKWYGISGYILLFLFEKLYNLLINKIYDLSNISFIDKINILKEIFTSDIKTKEVIITDDLLKKFGNVLEQMKSNVKINDEGECYFRILTYKLNDYYWRKLNKIEIEKSIIKSNNLGDKLFKKINIKKEPPFEIIIIKEGINKNRVIFKYTHLIPDIYAQQFIKIIKDEHFLNINEPSIILDSIFELILFPIHIILELIIIIIFYIMN